MCQTVKRGNRR